MQSQEGSRVLVWNREDDPCLYDFTPVPINCCGTWYCLCASSSIRTWLVNLTFEVKEKKITPKTTLRRIYFPKDELVGLNDSSQNGSQRQISP